MAGTNFVSHRTNSNFSQIERTFGLFDGDTFHGMGIDHGGSQVAVTEQFLHTPDIVIRLQQVAGKTVAKGVGQGTFPDRLFPQMILELGLQLGRNREHVNFS